MNVLEATDYLRRRQREDDDVRIMVAAAVTKRGCADLYAWAELYPKEVVMVAEAAKDMDDETAEFERRLETGDLT